LIQCNWAEYNALAQIHKLKYKLHTSFTLLLYYLAGIAFRDGFTHSRSQSSPPITQRLVVVWRYQQPTIFHPAFPFDFFRFCLFEVILFAKLFWSTVLLAWSMWLQQSTAQTCLVNASAANLDRIPICNQIARDFCFSIPLWFACSWVVFGSLFFYLLMRNRHRILSSAPRLVGGNRAIALWLERNKAMAVDCCCPLREETWNCKIYAFFIGFVGLQRIEEPSSALGNIAATNDHVASVCRDTDYESESGFWIFKAFDKLSSIRQQHKPHGCGDYPWYYSCHRSPSTLEKLFSRQGAPTILKGTKRY